MLAEIFTEPLLCTKYSTKHFTYMLSHLIFITILCGGINLIFSDGETGSKLNNLPQSFAIFRWVKFVTQNSDLLDS